MEQPRGAAGPAAAPRTGGRSRGRGRALLPSASGPVLRAVGCACSGSRGTGRLQVAGGRVAAANGESHSDCLLAVKISLPFTHSAISVLTEDLAPLSVMT